MSEKNIYLRLFIENNVIADLYEDHLEDLKTTTALPRLLKQTGTTAFQFLHAHALGTTVTAEYPMYYLSNDDVMRHPDDMKPSIKYAGSLRKLKPIDFVFDKNSGECLYGAERLTSVSSFFNPAILQRLGHGRV